MLRSRAVFAAAIVALVFACSSYGADEPDEAPRDGGTSSSGGSSSGNASSSGGGSSSGSTEGGVVGDASDDGSTFSEVCPPCAGTCVPSGCSGAGANNACNKPFDVTSSMSLVVFACPEGLTVPVPNQLACLNGGNKHAALLRLGAAPSKWNVKVQGTNPFALSGDCNGNTAGQCSSSQVDRDFGPFSTIAVGTSSNGIQSCVQLSVTLTAQ